MIEATERVLYSKDWVTLILMLIIALFVLAKYNYNERFSRLFSLLFSRNYLVVYNKQTPLLLNSFHVFFAIIQLFTFSLLIFIGIRTNNSIAREFEFEFFLSILAGVFIFSVLRYFAGKLLGVLLEKEKEHEQISYFKMSYLSNFSLLVFPFLIVTLYLDGGSAILSIITTVFAIMILLLYYALIIRDNQKFVFNYIFYFILYLCALEIAPLIFLYKLFIVKGF